MQNIHEKHGEPVQVAPAAFLSTTQLRWWNFIDQIFVKYGPLGVMLVAVVYYVVVKDKLIEKKDQLIFEQQSTMLQITKSSTEALVKSANSQTDLARSIDDNTKTMSRLVYILDLKK